FSFSNLLNANFSGATVSNVVFASDGGFNGTPFSAAQLYSTASYQARDLHGIVVFAMNLSGWNLAGQNLTESNFSNAALTGTDLSGADTRGVTRLSTTNSINTNLIHPDGHIQGLTLTASRSLLVRNYPLEPTSTATPIAITVDQTAAMDATSTLSLQLDSSPWRSLISFASGISVAIGGALDLDFAPGAYVPTQNGRTFRIFDWTGVAPTGGFTIDSPYAWDTSNLYTTGEVTLAIPTDLPGDFNNDHQVDTADYALWRKTAGSTAAYNSWRSHFGQSLTGSGSVIQDKLATIPEPRAWITLVLSVVLGFSWH